MRDWLERLWLRFWPWATIQRLLKALGDSEKRIEEAYNRGHADGIKYHLERWMRQSNAIYGAEPFNGNQLALMVRLYEDGFSSREALVQLRIAEGRDRFTSQYIKWDK